MPRFTALSCARTPGTYAARSCRSGGFTLLEMLVVLAITGLIAGLLYPQLQTATQAIAARHAREQIAAGIEGARALAQRSGAPAQLATIEGGTGLVVAAPAGPWRRLALGTGADAAGGMQVSIRPQTILFFPDGSTTGGELQITGPGGTARYMIDRQSGRLHETPGPRTVGSGGA